MGIKIVSFYVGGKESSANCCIMQHLNYSGDSYRRCSKGNMQRFWGFEVTYEDVDLKYVDKRFVEVLYKFYK